MPKYSLGKTGCCGTQLEPLQYEPVLGEISIPCPTCGLEGIYEAKVECDDDCNSDVWQAECAKGHRWKEIVCTEDHGQSPPNVCVADGCDGGSRLLFNISQRDRNARVERVETVFDALTGGSNQEGDE